AFTRYLGFEEHDEYKVMGLSAYGEPEYLSSFERIFRFDSRRMYRVDLSWIRHPGYADCPWGGRYYSDKVERTFGPARRPEAPLEGAHRNVATSLQRHLESVGVALGAHVRAQTGSRRLVIAGGVGLNGLMNHAIKSRAGFDEVFVQPASNDGGIAVGAALYTNHTILGR